MRIGYPSTSSKLVSRYNTTLVWYYKVPSRHSLPNLLWLAAGNLINHKVMGQNGVGENHLRLLQQRIHLLTSLVACTKVSQYQTPHSGLGGRPCRKFSGRVHAPFGMFDLVFRIGCFMN